jgi:hypothetical protein
MEFQLADSGENPWVTPTIENLIQHELFRGSCGRHADFFSAQSSAGTF